MAVASIKSIFLIASAFSIAVFSGNGWLATAAQVKPQELTAKPTNSLAVIDVAATTQDSRTSLVEELKLTDQQKLKIRGIRAQRTRLINQVLTPGQRTKFEAARKAGKSLTESLKELDLKSNQKKQIVSIAKKSAEEIKATLTKEQQKQLATYLKKQRGTTAGAVE
jgi:Spy/CpxP family protein refolding chaperone